MQVAALYDIHGNLPALEAVLEEIDRTAVDEIVVGGDVLPGPLAGDALERLFRLDRPARFIQGNGEREVLELATGGNPDRFPAAYRATMEWAAKQLDPGHRQRIAQWPATVRTRIDGLGDVLFCHATPRSDSEIFTRLTPEKKLLPLFDGSGADVVVCGHTHMSFDRQVGRVRVVNAGSVGMPFGEPGAYWLLLGPDIALQRTCYDLARAARRVRQTDYPQAEEFAARNILQPPSEQQTLRMFQRAEPG